MWDTFLQLTIHNPLFFYQAIAWLVALFALKLLGKWKHWKVFTFAFWYCFACFYVSYVVGWTLATGGF